MARHLRDFVYVTDVAAAIAGTVARLRDPALAGRVFNIGTGVGTPFDDLAHLVRERAGRAVPVRLAETGERREEVVATIDRARRELGYAPTVALADGLGRYLDWLRATLAAERSGQGAR